MHKDLKIRHEYFKEYYRNHKEKLISTAKKWQKNNKERLRSDVKKRTAEIKRMCIKHYGDKCSCCGEDNIKFLTMDHINNNGAEHRESIKNYNIYYWLKKHGYPDGYRVLCYNCNCGRAKNGGICPHKEPKSL